MLIVGFILICVGVIYGTYANEYWKLHQGSEKIAPFWLRAILGVSAWVSTICLMVGQYKIFAVAALVTVALLLIPFLLMLKKGIKPFKYIFIVLYASMGAYSRLLLSLTIIGILPKNLIVESAQKGQKKWAEDILKRMSEKR